MVLILGPLFIPDPRYAFTLYALLGLLCMNEMINLSKKTGNTPSRWFAFLIYAALTLLAYELFYSDIGMVPISIASGTLALLAVVVETFRSNEKPTASLAITWMMPLLVAASFLGINYFIAYRTDLSQPITTIALFGFIWLNDSGAYLVGSAIGKTKLIPRLSPNKTIEGSVGGLLVVIIAALVLSMYHELHWPIMLGFALVTAVFGSIGDLFESRVKRAAGVKDSGKFLPGHGGFFDRFDAMMLAIPAAILFFEAFVPKQ